MSRTRPAPGPQLLTRPAWVPVAAALAIVYVVWGSTYLAIRVVVQEADPLTSMGQRYAVAALILAGLLTLRRDARGRPGWHRLQVSGRQLLGAGVLGLFLPLLGNGMVAVAESRGATSGYVALLIAVTPLAIVVLRSLDRDRPSAMTLVGVLTGLGGLALLVLVGRGGADPVPLGPAMLVLFAGTMWAVGSYVQPRLWLPEDPFAVAVYEMAIGGLLMSVVGVLAGEEWSLDYGTRTWWALAYLVVFGSVLAFSAYVWLLARAPISLVATYAYVNPVIAVLLGWLLLEESVTPAMLLGGAVVVGSVAVVITAERRVTPSG